MAITQQNPRNVSVAAPGATVFPYDFKVLADTDLLVQVDGVTKAVGVDFTLSGVGMDAGGNITFLAPLVGGETVMRKREMPFQRLTDFQALGDLRSATLNNDQDAPVMMAQQLRDDYERALRVPASTPVAFAAEISGKLAPLGPLVINASGDGIEVGSTVLTGDMLLRGDLASSASGKGAALVTVVPPDPSALAQSVSAVLSNGVPVTWYATPEQCAIDATAATQAAINYAISSGRKAVYFPGGITYNFDASSPALDPGTGDVTFYGDGWHSILQFNEGPQAAVASAKHLFKNVSLTLKGNLVFRDLQFRGKWSDNAYAAGYGSAMFLDSYNSVELTNCRFYNFAYMVTICERIRNVKVMGCVFEQCAKDMVRFRSSFNVQVIGNRFKGSDDDCIAIHTLDSIDGANVREGVVVSGNVIEDTTGIRILSGRMVTVQNNILRRAKSHGIAIYATPSAGTEGDFSQFGVDVSNNQLYDTLERAPFTAAAASVIAVYSQGGKGGTETGGVVPGQNIVATGAFYLPWNYRDRNFSVEGESLPPQFFVRIQNNTIARTLPTVAAYDNWGFGQCMTATGFSNAAVEDADLRPTNGIYIEGNSRKSIIAHNIVAHTINPIFIAEATGNFGMDDMLIESNELSDYTTAAVNINNPSAVRGTSLTIRGNLIDGDPYHIHANRGAGGTWAADTNPVGVACTSHEGVRVEFNRFRNLVRPVSNSGSDNIYIRGNVVRMDPNAGGFSATNRGVGVVVTAGAQYNYEIFNCDPTSATYGAMLNASPERAAAMPSSGKWIAGAFVQNSDYVGLPGVHGWTRLTVGSAHVAGTDWRIVPLT